MRTSTLARRLPRVWEHLFNQTTHTQQRASPFFATMTTKRDDDGGGVVPSMWSRVEAAPKVRAMIHVFCILSLSSLGVFKGPPKTIIVVDWLVLHLDLVSRETFRWPLSFCCRRLSLVIIRTQSWGSRNCFTRTKIRRKCSSARALTETITVSL